MRTQYYMLDANGDPVPCEDVQVWGEWFERADRSLAQARDESGAHSDIRVSTVFLGIDHNFRESGAPVLWETLVFGGPLDGEMRRYSSKAAALQGHQAMCERVSAALQPPRPLSPDLH